MSKRNQPDKMDEALRGIAREALRLAESEMVFMPMIRRGSLAALLAAMQAAEDCADDCYGDGEIDAVAVLRIKSGFEGLRRRAIAAAVTVEDAAFLVRGFRARSRHAQ